MTDLTDLGQAHKITSLLGYQFEPDKPDPASENELLRAELRALESTIEEEKAATKSIRAILGAVIHFHLNDEVTLTAEELDAHPHSAFHLASTAHMLDGYLVLRTHA